MDACIRNTRVCVECFGVSLRVKAYYGSVEGCYFIINPLFVLPHRSAMTQIIGNLGEDRQSHRPGNLLGLELLPRPDLEDFKRNLFRLSHELYV